MKFLLFAIIVAAFAGCSGTNKESLKVEEPIVEVVDQSASPIDLLIEEDANDGERLHVKGSLRALTDWPKENVVVHLISVNGEEKVGESYYPLKQSGEPHTLSAGEAAPFAISVSAAGATDYRIELLWGDEGAAFLNANSPKEQEVSKAMMTPLDEISEPSNGIVLRSIKSEFKGEPCAEGSQCLGAFVVRGVLHNDGLEKADIVTLAIGLVDKSSRSPLSEEQVRVEALNLPGGGIREIKFDIAIPGGVSPFSLEPFVRVVDFGAK